MVTNVTAGAHVVGAATVQVLGVLLLVMPNGTARHRRLGYSYFILLVLLNISALSSPRQDVFGPFHILALLNLMTILAGVVMMMFLLRPPTVIAVHSYCMSWSFVGFVAAAMGQLVVQIIRAHQVLWVILGTLFLAASQSISGIRGR
jgi:uncharacterized membrane protein